GLWLLRQRRRNAELLAERAQERDARAVERDRLPPFRRGRRLALTGHQKRRRPVGPRSPMDLFDELRQLTLVVTGISKRLHVDRRQEVPDALRARRARV